MMYINTNVVRALMVLREISSDTIAKVAGLSRGLVDRWLMAKGHNHEDAVPVDIQFEILQYVGIKNGSPRPDIVHFWKVSEPFLGDCSSIYKALTVVLAAFGDAQVTFLTREVEPHASFKNVAHFGLKFLNFSAVLEITAHPLAAIKFSPEKLPGLTWAEGGHGVLLEDSEYQDMAKNELTAGQLNRTLTMVPEMMAWERLIEVAKSLRLNYDEVGDALKQLNEAKQLLAGPQTGNSTETTAATAQPGPESSSRSAVSPDGSGYLTQRITDFFPGHTASSNLGGTPRAGNELFSARPSSH